MVDLTEKLETMSQSEMQLLAEQMRPQTTYFGELSAPEKMGGAFNQPKEVRVGGAQVYKAKSLGKQATNFASYHKKCGSESNGGFLGCYKS